MNLSPELIDFISRVIQIIAVVLGAIMAGLWISLVIWAFRDMRRRSRDPFAQILAALLVAAIPFVGIVLYLIIRPPETLAERYERALEEEALLQEIEERPRCHKCKRVVDGDWVMCPSCHSQLLKQCARCFSLLEMKWRRCPRCTEIQPDVPLELTPELLLKTIFPPAPIVTVTSSQQQLPAPQPQRLPPPDQTRPVFRRRPVAIPQSQFALDDSDELSDNPTVSMEPIGIDEDENPTVATAAIDFDAINEHLNGKADVDENPTVIQEAVIDAVDAEPVKKKAPKTSVVKKTKPRAKKAVNKKKRTLRKAEEVVEPKKSE